MKRRLDRWFPQAHQRPKSTSRRLLPGMRAGDRHYRAYVGPPEKYDLVAANQFNLLTSLGLRDYHYLCDIGCGSLRGGRLFIPYLLPGHYFGIEPNRWLVVDGIAHEVGDDLFRIKRPHFLADVNFSVTAFGRRFDFVLAQSIFSHADRLQMRRCLSQVALAMPNGTFAATAFIGTDSGDPAGWRYPECRYFTESDLRSDAEEAGLSMEMLEYPHPNGQSWLLYRPRPKFRPAE
jgi:hypothetical protein